MRNGKKITYNLMLGFISEIVTILLGIIVPRLVLTNYGSEVNGLINSVTQIYAYIALLEAGIGAATVQALYRTLGKNSRAETNAVLAATNRYYHRTGLLYLLSILIFSTLYPLFIKSDIPFVTIVLVIVFNGLGSVINFFFQKKYLILLQAEGKNYIQSSLTMFTNVFRNVARIVLIACGFDVVFVQAIAMVVSLIQMLYITWYIKRNYSWIDLTVKPDYSSISQSKNVLIHQISGLAFDNTDTVLLTIFAGLKTVSIYSVYTLLFSMIRTAISTISNSIDFVLGQTFHTDRKRFIQLYDVYELYYITTVFALYSVANFFILPFIKLYTSGVTDIEYVDAYLPLLFILIYLLSCGRYAPMKTIEFAVHFKQTQYRSILGSVINVTVSLIAVQRFGIYGVLMGTIVALLYRSNDMILYANHKILNRKAWPTYKRWLINLTLFILQLWINQKIHLRLDSYMDIIMWCIPYTIVTLILFFGVASLTEWNSAKFAWGLLKSNLINRSITRR